MDLSDVVNRVILPVLTRCVPCGKSRLLPGHEYESNENLPTWRGWHAARRGPGTNLYGLGVPEKTIQAILRHANVSRTMTYYIKTAAEDAQADMAKLQQSLLGDEWAMDVVSPQSITVQ